MSTYDHRRRTTGSEEKLAVLEAVRRHHSIRFSALAETVSIGDDDARDILLELCDDELVSTCPLRGEDDSVVTSLPRLRRHERTKIHRLIYN
jgi:HEAT repeat protein